MEITDEILRRSVAQQPFGAIEPFITGEDREVRDFYDRVLAEVVRSGNVSTYLEPDHHGSGYASYISAFLYPSDGNSQQNAPEYTSTTGVLLYLSRLAPIAAYGASARTESLDGRSSSSGFISIENVGIPPEGHWSDFVAAIRDVLRSFGVELLARESLLIPAPTDLCIPTVFDGPYYIFDALFYWED